MIVEPTAFPARAEPAERLRFFLSYAVLAPSRHNAQPWVFEDRGGRGAHPRGRPRALPGGGSGRARARSWPAAPPW